MSGLAECYKDPQRRIISSRIVLPFYFLRDPVQLGVGRNPILPNSSDYFLYYPQHLTEQKEKVFTLQSDITHLDREKDQLVYELYELTEEEIRIVGGIEKDKPNG